MSDSIRNYIPQIDSEIENLTSLEALKKISSVHDLKIIFSTSFSYEDQVITDMIAIEDLNVSIFTLDTGRLFAETYSVWNATRCRYNQEIKAYYPNDQLLERFVTEKGPNSFYESLENRKDCCYIRKVEPLKRALKGYDIWVTGLRAEHSDNRQTLQSIEWDEGNRIIKYHPLLRWSTKDVTDYINKNNIPYNPLHDKGFVSIGCQPCTRAIKPGEDFRAGRWWWEDASKKECGLHELKTEQQLS